MDENISFDYIRGLTEGEGSFTFSTIGIKDASGHKKKLPAFILSMSRRDYYLLEAVKRKLGLRNVVYSYLPRKKKGDSYNRQGMSVLIVRDFGQLKNIIVPFFYKRLAGNKGRQFREWLEKIGADPYVPDRYKFIYKLYKDGFYDRNPKYTDFG